MDVVTAPEADSDESGYYHLLNEEETGSICGAITDESLFAGNSLEVISQEEAENRGLQHCEECMTFTGDR